ncbi:hypothetical protein ABW21_db0203797 [Orbilia brochopaga]|nr:hypothetical protein ABW21_db0203797 [Drechslerella brochopaga]
MDSFAGNQSDDGKGSGPSSPENDVEDALMEDDAENDDGSDNDDKESDGENENDDDDENADDDDNDNADDADPASASQQLQRERESESAAAAAAAAAAADTRWRPVIRPGALTARTYDIIPYVAAPMSTSIHAFTATPCMKWIFTGGQDGYIRKYDWFASINGKVPLTVAQKHPFVDSVTRAGVLLSYWENEEIPDKNSLFAETDDIRLSPVYSLATHSQALWLLSGLESGNINLQSVRHDESKIITVLRKHKSAVSVLGLSADEKSLISGSWDKDLLDWDLNTGEVARTYTPQAGQLSAFQWRPQSVIPIPIERQPIMNGITASSISRLAGEFTNNRSPKIGTEADADAPGSPASSGGFDSLFGGDDDDLFGAELSNGRTAQNSTLTIDGDDDVLMGEAHPQPAEQQLINENASSAAAAAAAAAADTANSHATENTASSDTVGDMNMDFPDTRDALGEPVHSPTQLGGIDGTDVSSNVFLAGSIDGIVRIYDRRQDKPITRLLPGKGIPPWSTSACWGVDGNYVYVGRRNGTVEEYSIHKDFQNSVRTLKFPGGSGPVSHVAPMANGRHLVCASFDNLRLYDLKDEEAAKHSRVPFLIVPGHHGGVLSSVYVDATCRYLLTMAGNRGWEGTSTEVMLGYEIVPVM